MDAQCFPGFRILNMGEEDSCVWPGYGFHAKYSVTPKTGFDLLANLRRHLFFVKIRNGKKPFTIVIETGHFWKIIFDKGYFYSSGYIRPLLFPDVPSIES